jgi:fructose-1,6-bisphosphatase/inositol monophosphatase family enzyme
MSSSDDIDEIARRIEREIQRNAEALEEYDEVSYEEDVVSQMDFDAEELFS